MNQYQSRETITFNELHHEMKLDPYYGVEGNTIGFVINAIYYVNYDNKDFQQFADRFSLLPCKREQQRHLIYIWCGLMGLSRYEKGILLNHRSLALLDNWTTGFGIRLDELQDFLRQYSFPLPVKLFPDAVDNTETKLSLSGTAYSRACRDYYTRIDLEKDQAELENIQPESMEARQQKKTDIKRIDRQISKLKSEIESANRIDSECADHKPKIEVGSPEWRHQNAQNAANVRHNKSGGSREKQKKIRDAWQSGNYSTRDICAEQECAALDMSFSAARRALRNIPKS